MRVQPSDEGSLRENVIRPEVGDRLEFIDLHRARPDIDAAVVGWLPVLYVPSTGRIVLEPIPAEGDVGDLGYMITDPIGNRYVGRPAFGRLFEGLEVAITLDFPNVWQEPEEPDPLVPALSSSSPDDTAPAAHGRRDGLIDWMRSVAWTSGPEANVIPAALVDAVAATFDRKLGAIADAMLARGFMKP